MRAGWAAKMTKTMELFRSEEMQLMQVSQRRDTLGFPLELSHLPY